jgi:hypothetical protein
MYHVSTASPPYYYCIGWRHDPPPLLISQISRVGGRLRGRLPPPNSAPNPDLRLAEINSEGGVDSSVLAAKVPSLVPCTQCAYALAAAVNTGKPY